MRGARSERVSSESTTSKFQGSCNRTLFFSLRLRQDVYIRVPAARGCLFTYIQAWVAFVRSVLWACENSDAAHESRQHAHLFAQNQFTQNWSAASWIMGKRRSVRAISMQSSMSATFGETLSPSRSRRSMLSDQRRNLKDTLTSACASVLLYFLRC